MLIASFELPNWSEAPSLLCSNQMVVHLRNGGNRNPAISGTKYLPSLLKRRHCSRSDLEISATRRVIKTVDLIYYSGESTRNGHISTVLFYFCSSKAITERFLSDLNTVGRLNYWDFLVLDSWATFRLSRC